MQKIISIANKRQGMTLVVPIEAHLEIGLQPLKESIFNHFNVAGAKARKFLGICYGTTEVVP